MRRGKAVGGGFEKKMAFLCGCLGVYVRDLEGEKAGPRLRF